MTLHSLALLVLAGFLATFFLSMLKIFDKTLEKSTSFMTGFAIVALFSTATELWLVARVL